ncbi:MAG: hypothetical protein KC766_26780, partial [Myxococcales bacterium]|nr:hypothetical protein [Myxococcales bacterium]
MTLSREETLHGWTWRSTWSAAGLAVFLLASGCSNLLGLDDFHAAATGGDGGAGGGAASGGDAGTSSTAGVGGSAGSGNASGAGGGAGAPECSAGNQEDCYSGPSKTQNVGICVGGTRVCGQDSRWGVCSGEQTPQVEDCGDSTQDENCDKFECGIWGLVYSQGSGTPSAVDVADDGTVYIAGDFAGGLQIGGQTKPALDAHNAYIASLKPDGTVNWVYTVGSGTFCVVWGIVGAADGELYAVLTTDEAVDYGDGVRPAGTTLLRLANGAVVSSLSLGVGYAPGLRVRGGHLYLAGTFNGSIDWGTGSKSSEGDDIVLAKLGLDLSVGQDGWVKTFGSAGDDGGLALDVDSTGNVYLGGGMGGQIDFGGGPEFFSSQQDAFLVKLGPSGDYLGAITKSGVGGTEAVWSVGVDDTGAVVAVGIHDKDLNVKGKTLPATGQNSLFVIRWAWDGTGFSERWGVGFGDTTAVGFGRTRLDAAGRPLVAATSVASVTLGQEVLPAVPDGLPFVARFDDSGNHIWHRSFGTS